MRPMFEAMITGCDIAPATVETYISHLRSKVDLDDGPRLIHTMRGAGYALHLDDS
jgi:DNA-binding response OmpR family regulator